MKSQTNLLLITLAVFVMLLLFPSTSAIAQGGFGTVVGTITDSSGAVVPNAKITVTDPGTQVIRAVQSNDQGYFVIPALRPSTYDLSVTAQGFSTYSQKGVTLLTDQSLTVDIHLAVGQVSQAVEVQTSGVQVDTSTSTISQVVEEKRIVDLPLNGRNPVTLALLVPGTVQAPADGR